MDFLSGELFVRFLGVLAIDLILSGDNAVVIALAVRNLEGKTRKRAVLWGTIGAVGLPARLRRYRDVPTPDTVPAGCRRTALAVDSLEARRRRPLGAR